MRLKEKGIFLTNYYRIEAILDPKEQLDEKKKGLLKLVREYGERNNEFSPEKLCSIFEAARKCQVSVEGSTMERDCYMVSRIDCFPVQTAGQIKMVYELSGLPKDVRGHMGQVFGNRVDYRDGNKKIHVFFKDNLGKRWNSCGLEEVTRKQLQGMVPALLTRQDYDRGKFAEGLWHLDIPVFQIRPGIRRDGKFIELVFYGIPLVQSQKTLVIPYQEYFDWLMGGTKEENLKQGAICYANAKKNMEWIQEIYRRSGIYGKSRFSQEEWASLRLNDTFLKKHGVYSEFGASCEVLIEGELFERISLILNRKNFGNYLVITEDGRVSAWEKNFPDFQVYSLSGLKNEFEIKDSGRCYSIIWDIGKFDGDNTGFPTFLHRFLHIAEVIVFLDPQDVKDLGKQEKLAEMIGRSDLPKLTVNAVQKAVAAAYGRKEIYEFTIRNQPGKKRRLIEYLMKTGTKVGILVRTEAHAAEETKFLNRYFPNRWAAASDPEKNCGNASIFLMNFSDIYTMQVNHYFAAKKELSEEWKRTIVCTSQSRGLRNILCIYQID